MPYVQSVDSGRNFKQNPCGVYKLSSNQTKTNPIRSRATADLARLVSLNTEGLRLPPRYVNTPHITLNDLQSPMKPWSRYSWIGVRWYVGIDTRMERTIPPTSRFEIARFAHCSGGAVIRWNASVRPDIDFAVNPLLTRCFGCAI